jgi:hypothetical protein
MKRFILWALPAGSTDRLDEQPLTSFPLTREQAERVKQLAAGGGWHGFRLSEDADALPDFAAAIQV